MSTTGIAPVRWVVRQYCGQLGKKANCQSLVCLTLARGEVPVPVRCAQAGVPEAAASPRSKGEIALAELDRLPAEGVGFGVVLADAGYGATGTRR